MPQSLRRLIPFRRAADTSTYAATLTMTAAVAALVKLGEPRGRDMLIRAFIDNEDVQWTE